MIIFTVGTEMLIFELRRTPFYSSLVSITFFYLIAKHLPWVLLATIVPSGAKKLFKTLQHCVAFLSGQAFVPGVFVCTRAKIILDSFTITFGTRSSALEKLCGHFTDNYVINREYWSDSNVFMACFIWYFVMKQNTIEI